MIIKDETIRIDSSSLYKELKGKDGIRDLHADGRLLTVDNISINFVNCDFICEDDIPNSVFEDLE